MNFKSSEWAIIVSSLLCAYLIWLFVAEPRIIRIESLKQQATEQEKELIALSTKHNKFKKEEADLLANPSKLWSKTRTLLKPGFEESNLMKLILSCTRGCTDSFTISSFHIMDPYYVHPAAEETDYENIDIKDLVIDMETGMPIGAEIDDGSWQGVEIVPVRLTYVTSFKSLMEFFNNFRGKKLPLYSIRSLDINFIDSKFVRGTLVLGFPLAKM
jgi:hypothetical protein